MEKTVPLLLLFILLATLLLAVAIYILSVYNRIFLKLRSLWLRRNIVVLVVALSIMSALLILQAPEGFTGANAKTAVNNFLKQIGYSAVIVLFVFNVTWFVSRIKSVKALSFVWHHVVIMITIVASALFVYTIFNYLENGYKFKGLKFTLIYAYYNALLTGLIYASTSYIEMNRRRKLNEKELEVTRLIALKTKAELDALHSKVNPHFLYNALNSIADLAITDGRKARRMTIALADLFRYSINYSQNNYSTVNDEVDMTEVYLQIEKIRFEDQLNYSVSIEEGMGHYLVPRFLLQPLVENAVKHGLKMTGKLTEIFLEIKKTEKGMAIDIYDNGPPFPTEISPGYGVKSVFDKMDLLFHENFEIHFINEPRKKVSILLHKLMKNEPAL